MKWIALLCFLVLTDSSVLVGQDGWRMMSGCRERTSWVRDVPELRPPFDARVIPLPSPYSEEPGLYIDFLSAMDGTLFLGNDGEPCSVIALETSTGSVLWRATIDSSGGAIGSCPAIAGDLVISGAQGAKAMLTGFDRRTGTIVWRKFVQSAFMKSPIVDGDRMFIKTDSLYCLDPLTGQTYWSHPMHSNRAGTPAVDEANIYYAVPDTLYARDKRTGALRWSSAGGRYEAIAVDDTRVYVSAFQAIRAVDKSNGGELWKVTIPDGRNVAYISGNGFAVDDRFLVYAVWSNKDSVGTLTCLDKTTGAERWTHIFPAEGCFAPTIAGGCVYVTTWKDRTFWAFDPASGSVLLRDDSRMYEGAQPIEDNGVLYVTCRAAGAGGFQIIAFSPRPSGMRDAALREEPEIDVYPQPITGSATVVLRLVQSQEVRLDLVDALGRHIVTVDGGSHAPGTHTRSFSLPSGAAAGMYFLRCAGDKRVRMTPLLHLP